MSVQWMAVQIIGDTLRLPIAGEASLDKPFGCTSIGRDVEHIVVNPLSDSPKAFEPKRGTCKIETVSTDARDWPDNQRCSACGEYVSVLAPESPRYCPNCGRRVVDS